MQAGMAKMQQELESEVVKATSGGGMVKVVISGKMKIMSIIVSPDVVDSDDIEMLQDLIVAAVNEGLIKAQELASGRMRALTGGLNIPGLTQYKFLITKFIRSLDFVAWLTLIPSLSYLNTENTVALLLKFKILSVCGFQ